MDFSESTKVVYNRIQKLEPENVSKIIGYLLLQDHGDREMIRLAFSPDKSIQSFINKAKIELRLPSKPVVSSSTSSSSSSSSSPEMIPSPISDIPLQFTPFVPSSSRSLSSPGSLQIGNLYHDRYNFTPLGYSDLGTVDDYLPRSQIHLLNLEDQLETDVSSNYYYLEPTLVGPRANRRSPSLPEFPVKLCHYFSKGFCKHGDNCRYFHSYLAPENNSPTVNETGNEDHMFTPGSLEKLELELTELLKSRRGLPVSIASLPMLYYEKYRRTLQAEGYLTESQRQGKAGYSLTKLLARLKSRIRLIDRPHGQHSVILVEDLPKYLDYSNERTEHGGFVACSRQIYLTFPAESTFTEKDVSNYFSTFGPVQDVRIPCQQKRMFGFVTFISPETVKQILTKGNPHFVCGARVLVKPYREKSRLVDRKYSEKIQQPVYYGSHFQDLDSEFHFMPRVCDNSRLLRKQQFIEEHEEALELERRRFSELQLASKHLNHNQLYLGYSEEAVPSAEHFDYVFDGINIGSTSEDRVRHMSDNYNDQESSQGFNLPESPFASPIGNGISTVI